MLDKELKGKIVPKIPVILVIKVATFNMNPKFTEVTLNSLIFVMDIFSKNLERRFRMINVTHEVSFCLLQ